MDRVKVRRGGGGKGDRCYHAFMKFKYFKEGTLVPVLPK